jgi:hypothetical protein
MPLYTPRTAARLLNFERFASDEPATLGATLRAQAAQAISESPLNSLLRMSALSEAERTGAVLTKADAEQRINDAGVAGRLTVPDSGITDQALDVLIRRKREEIKRQDVFARGPQGLGAKSAQFATAFAASLLDPVNVGLAFVPVVGEARYASMLARASGALGRAGVRVGVGAVEGVAGAAIAEVPIHIAKTQEQADYTMSDSLLNIAFGAAFGGGLHVLGGAAKDVFSPARAAAEASPLRVRESALRTAVGQLQAGEAVNIEPVFTAYHGSPHKFETFDAGRIGTGEGSDAYGHGLYFAEARSVGEHYRGKLTPDAGYARMRIAELQKGVVEAEMRIADLERIHGAAAMSKVIG